jgi:hypothetical protein
MRLGEALVRRAELQTKLRELRGRLGPNALVQEGDSPAENPTELLAEFDRVADELERMIGAINKTNTATEVRPDLTLTQALARRDVLALRHEALTTVADATEVREARYSRSEIRLVRTFDVAAVRKRADELASDRRRLDADIQAKNWTVDLAEE